MHRHFYTFKAISNYEMGLMMGSKFEPEAVRAIEQSCSDKDWGKKVDVAKLIFEVANKFFPQYISELQGYASGANVDFWDFFTIALEDDVDLQQNTAKCTTIVTNNGSLFGHSEDTFSSGYEDTVCLLKRQIGGTSTFEIFYYNTLGGASVGINSHGYCHSGNTLFFTPVRIGVPKSFLSRSLFDSKDPVNTVNYFNKIPRGSGYNQNVLSFSGEFVNFEITADKINTNKTNFPFVHTNHCLINSNNDKDDYGTNTRNQVAKDLVKPFNTVEELETILEDSSRGNDKSIYNERTIGRGIFDIKNRDMYVWLKREENLGWVKYPFDFLIG